MDQQSQAFKEFHADHSVRRVDQRIHYFGPFAGLIGGTVAAAVSYPFVALQTLSQTQITSGNTNASAYNTVKQQKFMMRGFAPFLMFGALSGALSSASFLGPLLSGAAFPFEAAQIKLTADQADPSNKFNLQQTLQSMTKANAFQGASILVARNYLIYLGYMLSSKTSSIFILPTVLGGIVLDNLRRNFVVANLCENGTKVSIKELFNNIYKEHGYKGLLRGASFYPTLYAAPLFMLAGNRYSKH